MTEVEKTGAGHRRIIECEGRANTSFRNGRTIEPSGPQAEAARLEPVLR